MGHIQVCQQQAVFFPAYHFHQFRHIGAGIAVYSFLGIHLFQHQEQHLVIVDGYDIEVSILPVDISLYLFFQHFFGFRHRYFHRETASFTFLTFQMDFTAEHRHYILHDSKPQSEAVLCSGI